MNITKEQEEQLNSKLSKLMEDLMGDMKETMEEVRGWMLFQQRFLAEWRSRWQANTPAEDSAAQVLTYFLNMGEETASDGLKKLSKLLEK